MSRTVAGERDRVKMIFGGCADFGPLQAAVFRDGDRPARSDHNQVATVMHVKSVQTRNQTRALPLPLKATVRGVKNHAVRAYCPAMELVIGKTNRADRVALRQRVLPFPTTIGGLCERGRDKRRDDQNQEIETQRARSQILLRSFAANFCSLCVVSLT